MTASDSAPGLRSADWAGETSQRWAAHAERLEAMLAPVDDILLSAAGIRRGDRVLDIGCGRGMTSRAAAALAGPTGAVLGIDISPTLIDEASRMPPGDGAAPISWVAADAAAHPFPAVGFDVAISRFGVMFFEDPAAAFANIARSVRSGGRLVAVVWQHQDASEFQWLSIDVAVRVAAEHGVTLRPRPAAGPFAYGTRDHTGPILEGAGWADVRVQPHELSLYVGGPGTTPEQAVEIGRQTGPLAMLLRDTPASVADAVADALVAEMHTRWDGTGVALSAGIAVVTAHRP
ncbi:MAG: methyltransferase domain-containing protein [Ilumatobacteraceae bacterium]